MGQGKFVERVLFLLALSSISSLLLITVFIFLEGMPLIFHTGLKEFSSRPTGLPPRATSASWP